MIKYIYEQTKHNGNKAKKKFIVNHDSPEYLIIIQHGETLKSE